MPCDDLFLSKKEILVGEDAEARFFEINSCSSFLAARLLAASNVGRGLSAVYSSDYGLGNERTLEDRRDACYNQTGTWAAGVRLPYMHDASFMLSFYIGLMIIPFHVQTTPLRLLNMYETPRSSSSAPLLRTSSRPPVSPRRHSNRLKSSLFKYKAH